MPARPYDLPRLCAAIRTSRQGLEYPRGRREQMVRALAGPDWSEETSWDLTEPVNLLDLYVKVILPNLVAPSPRCLLETFDQDSKPAVAAMERWLNLEIDRSNFAGTMKRVVLDALFLIGIVKVGIATPDEAAGSAWKYQAGQPYVCPVDFDDFAYDLHARRLEDSSFFAHRVRKPLDAVRSSKLYSKGRKELTASRDPSYNQQGDQRISVLGRGFRGANSYDYEDMVDLWEVYLPRHKLVITLAANDGGDPDVGSDGEPLRVANWVGPECGPFHFLGYLPMPGNALPKGPIQSLFKLNEVYNHLQRKLIRQAQDQKTVVGVAGSADQDGNRIVNCSDGQVIRIDDPKAIATLVFNGPHAMNFQYAESVKMLFNYLAGNMDSFGGLSSEAKTLGQERLLSENSSRLISDMQANTLACYSSVMKALGWFHWEHPFNEQSYEHPVPGGKRGFNRTIYPRNATDPQGRPQLLRRQVPFEQLDLRCDLYSTQQHTPASRLQDLEKVLQIWAPFAPLSAQQGVGPDWNFFFAAAAKYLDSPDLERFLMAQAPTQPGSGGDGGGPGMPAQTERTYTRQNVPMRTERGASQQLMAKLSGVDTGGAPKNGQVVGAQ